MARDDLRENLTRFAWNGIEFPGTDISTAFGHDLARHAGYGERGADFEPTGPKPEATRVRAVLQNGLRGWRGDKLFPTVYRRLVRELRRGAEGTLTHPTRGTFRAVFDDGTEEIKPLERQGVMLSLSFSEQRGSAGLFEGAARVVQEPGAAMLSAATTAVDAAPTAVVGAVTLVDDAGGFLAWAEDTSRTVAELTAGVDAFQSRVLAMLDDPAAAVIDAHPFRGAVWALSSATADYRARAIPAARSVRVPTTMSLARVAALPEAYGDARRARDLARANTIPNPARVPAGTVLIVPE